MRCNADQADINLTYTDSYLSQPINSKNYFKDIGEMYGNGKKPLENCNVESVNLCILKLSHNGTKQEVTSSISLINNQQHFQKSFLLIDYRT